jgi:hypothetical protein
MHDLSEPKVRQIQTPNLMTAASSEVIEAYTAKLQYWNQIERQESLANGSVSEATRAAYKEDIRCKCTHPQLCTYFPNSPQKNCKICCGRLYHLEIPHGR